MYQFPKHMLQVFKSTDNQESFEKNGFVVLPFYTPEEIIALTDLYHELHPQDEIGFFPSTFSKDKNYRSIADAQIREIGQRSIEHYCRDVKVVCGAFIVKNIGVDSGMCVRQDMSLVDESKYTGINIWVPLVDLTIKNGALFVLRGSHRMVPTYRGSSIPECFSLVMDEILDFMEPVIVKAGEAVIFDQSIIHFLPSPSCPDNAYATAQKAATSPCLKWYFSARVAIISVTSSLAESPVYRDWETDRKSTRLNSSHSRASRMPSSA